MDREQFGGSCRRPRSPTDRRRAGAVGEPDVVSEGHVQRGAAGGRIRRRRAGHDARQRALGGGQGQRPAGHLAAVAGQVVGDRQGPGPVGILADEGAHGLLRHQRRRRHQVGVGMIRHQAVVGRVRHLPERVGVVVPDRAVEHVVVAAVVVGGQGDDGARRRHQGDVQVAGVRVLDEGRRHDFAQEGRHAGDDNRGGHYRRAGGDGQ